MENRRSMKVEIRKDMQETKLLLEEKLSHKKMKSGCNRNIGTAVTKRKGKSYMIGDFFTFFVKERKTVSANCCKTKGNT